MSSVGSCWPWPNAGILMPSVEKLCSAILTDVAQPPMKRVASNKVKEVSFFILVPNIYYFYKWRDGSFELHFAPMFKLLAQMTEVVWAICIISDKVSATLAL